MSKLRIIYIAALGILGFLLVFTVFKPMATGEELSEVTREAIIQSEDQWIIQFDIISYEGEGQNYTISIWVDGKPSTESVAAEGGKVFTYIHHIYKGQITKGDIRFTVYKEGDDTPIKQVSYYLK